ncbi:MAG: molybdenum cofactor guanylyltransferase [Pirellulaceae bacterium]|nr:molybdenum cofactor guanylyltransferase [Pirellulaceae bacterium]
MRTGGIILCGGLSSRMGRAKAGLPFGPELMLQRVVRLLGQVVDSLVVVAAAQQDLPPLSPQVRVVRDRRENRGPLEGLYAGLEALQDRAEAAYATSCDVPLLVPEFVQMMLRRLDDHQVAVPVDGEFHHPLAAVYRTDVLPEIQSLLAADQLRPRFLFERVRTCRVPVEELRAVDPDLQTLANLNTPADYFAAARRAGWEVPAELREALDTQHSYAAG